MIDNFVSMTGSGSADSRRSCTCWSRQERTARSGLARLEVPRSGRALQSGAVVRLPLAPRRPTLSLERLRSHHRRVAVCWPRSSGTLRPLASVRETSVIKISHSATSVKVTFALPADETAAGCSVVGDFNGWQPGMHQLRRRSNGTRSASVTLPMGTQTRFRYLSDNGHWFNDPDVIEFDGPD